MAQSQNLLESDLESFRQRWLSDLHNTSAPAPAPAPALFSASVTTPRSGVTWPMTLNASAAHTDSLAHSRRNNPPAPCKPPAPDDAEDDEDLTDTDWVHVRHLQSSFIRDHPSTQQITIDTSTPKSPSKASSGPDKQSNKVFYVGFEKPEALAKLESTRSASPPRPPLPRTDEPPFDELILSFASSAILPLEPEVDDFPKPHCLLARLPEEILLHILGFLAVMDVGFYCRLALVCRRLAYLVVTEEQIWRRVCNSDEFGFSAMHFRWNRPAVWDESEPSAPQHQDWREENEASSRRRLQALRVTRELVAQLNGGPWRGSWLSMFRERPRIRFHGCYISTSTYSRSGLSGMVGSVSLNDREGGDRSGRKRDPSHDLAGARRGASYSWNSTAYQVVYYRYLRFFRDGSVVGLLTVSEPVEVVRHLRRGPPEEDSVLNKGLFVHGRWRMAPPEGVSIAADEVEDGKLSEAASAEFESNSPFRDSDLLIETEGIDERFMCRMELSIKSTRGGRRRSTHNKLTWKSYHSYNRLTDDWAEIWLRSDRPFYFSRVKSYGVYGE